MIPIHPQAGPHPGTVRWRTPAGVLPCTGPVTDAPEDVRRLLDDGTVAALRAGADHVDVTLAEGHAWSADGARVRTALLAALERPEAWRTGVEHPETGGDADLDVRLRTAAETALAGEVGELARSHGGAIELESVCDGVVTVRMRGACHGCPAAEVTLHARLERVLRDACPDLREVRSLEPESGVRRAAHWLTLGRRAG